MAKQNIQSVNWTTIAIVAVLVIGFLFAIFYLYPRETSDKTVSVTGNAVMQVLPDRVVVYAQVLTRSKDSAEEAKNLNAQLSDAILTALIKAGVNRSDIETSGFSVYPEYDWIQDKGQVLKGYAASNSMKITIADFENAGKIVDAVVNNGGLISYINYELSAQKMNEYKAQALAHASQDAKVKAESIVKGLGRTLGDVVSVSASDYNYIPYPIYRAEGATADLKEISTNLPSAKLEVTATVSVTYKIN
ncbi:MAG: SIMPL domain-containing protein [Candidatus Micrarchaeota archaeon]|nr:SIMPL domain-containing protein [Candidatus Micrarchaeota archaeon]